MEDIFFFSRPSLFAGNIDGQLDILRLESRLRVPARYRFPFFEDLMWYSGQHYAQALRQKGGTADLSSFEVQGLRELAAVLRVWAASVMVCYFGGFLVWDSQLH